MDDIYTRQQLDVFNCVMGRSHQNTSDGHRTEWVLYPIFPTDGSYFSILSASDVCECCKVLYRNPFCPMAIRCPSDVKYFWCERAIKDYNYHLYLTSRGCWFMSALPKHLFKSFVIMFDWFIRWCLIITVQKINCQHFPGLTVSVNTIFLTQK